MQRVHKSFNNFIAIKGFGNNTNPGRIPFECKQHTQKSRTDTKKCEHQITIGLKDSPEYITFEISDNGIGMDRETREKAFTLFFSSKGSGGTGLGLFIADKIVESHGGSITIESEQGKWSRFIVKIPRKHPGIIENNTKSE